MRVSLYCSVSIFPLRQTWFFWFCFVLGRFFWGLISVLLRILVQFVANVTSWYFLLKYWLNLDLS
jgi:hypothetical protein